VELERIDSEGIPVLIHVPDEPADAFVSPVDDALELCSEREPLTVWVGQADQVIDSPGVEGFERAPRDLDVLLRNRDRLRLKCLVSPEPKRDRRPVRAQE
jgi:hypothetical protein